MLAGLRSGLCLVASQHLLVGCSPLFGPLQMEVFLNRCQCFQYRK